MTRQIWRAEARARAKLACEVFKGETRLEGPKGAIRTRMHKAGVLTGWRGNPPDWRAFYVAA